MSTKVNNRDTKVSCTIFGSTGLIGSNLRALLAGDKNFQNVHLASRREIDLGSQSGLIQHIIDFDKLETYPELFEVDVIFVCLGTTMKQAGSKEAFEKVDKHLVHEIAHLAKKHQCKKLLLISSLGADSSSTNFYLKTKGKAEELVRQDGPEEVLILRPALLLGDRNEFRFGEQIAQWLMPIFSFLMIGGFRKYRPIKANTVAKGLQILAKQDHAETVLISDQIQSLVDKHQ